MFVEFSSMVIQDFKAFRGRHSLALNGTGVVYIIGENKVSRRLSGNGAAKSTIWDALTWCLFGKTPSGLTTANIKPWNSKGKPSVAVMLIVDGHEYLVRRATSPKNLFTINDQERADLGEVLPMSFELFVNTILLPQGRDLFFDLRPSEKMELVAEARGLERWDARASAAGKAADLLDEEVSKLDDEQRATNASLEEIDRSLATTRTASKAWNDAAQARQVVSKTAIKTLEKELENRDKELAGAILKEDGALLELRSSENEVSKLRDMINDVVAELRGLKVEMNALTHQSTTLEDELNNLANAKECPTCGQLVKAADLADHRKHLKAKIGEISLKIAAKLKRRKAVTVKGEGLQAELERHASDIEHFRQAANSASDVVLRLRPEKATLESRLAAARATKDEVNPHLSVLASLAKRRKLLEADLVEIAKDTELAKQRVVRAKFWVKGFKDIKLQLIEELMRELELVANGMIEEVGLEDWQIKFDIEKETKSGTIQRLINVQISSPESEGFVRWESWSGGEKQRLKLIGSLSLSDVLLSQVGIETNLEVLDEPAMYWSSEGVQELCAFLSTRSKEQDKTIFYIEHNTVESTHFSEVLKVIKDAKGARIS